MHCTSQWLAFSPTQAHFLALFWSHTVHCLGTLRSRRQFPTTLCIALRKGCRYLSGYAGTLFGTFHLHMDLFITVESVTQAWRRGSICEMKSEWPTKRILCISCSSHSKVIVILFISVFLLQRLFKYLALFPCSDSLFLFFFNAFWKRFQLWSQLTPQMNHPNSYLHSVSPIHQTMLDTPYWEFDFILRLFNLPKPHERNITWKYL